MDLRETSPMIARLPNQYVWRFRRLGAFPAPFFIFESGRKMKILIADDSKFMRRLIRINVESLGHTVVAEAENGLQAVEGYFEHQPDVVFIDMVMPVMGGLEAIKEIMKNDKNAKIIMCSSMGHTTYIMEAILNGARDFIVKPFNPEKIKEAMTKISN